MQQIRLGREQTAAALACGVRFFLAAALTASQTPGPYAPFALGCVAASGAGSRGAAALAGAGVGAALFLDFAAALPFLAVAVLIYTAAVAFRGTRLAAGRWLPSLTAAGLFLAVGGIYVVQSLSPLEELTACTAAAALTGASAWAYRPLLEPGRERLEPGSLLFLGVSLVLALADVTVLDLSVGRTLLCLLLLCIAYQQGGLAGAGVGLTAGLAADLCAGGGHVLFAGAYGLAGLAAGSRGGSRAGTAGLYLGCAFLALLPVRDPLAQPLLLEVLFGAGLFLMLPGRLFGGKRVLRSQAGEGGAVMERLKGQLNRTAAALRDLYDSLGRAAPVSAEENPAIVFDRAAEKVCRGCALCELCWQREYTGTFNAFNDATPYLLERGRALPKDFPGYFANRCIHLPDLLAAVNGELSAYLLRRQYRR